MKKWDDIGLNLFSVPNKIGDKNVFSTGLMTEEEERVIIEPKLKYISPPLGEPNWNTGAYGVVRSWKGRCGLFHIPVPFQNEAMNPEILWLQSEVASVKYVGKGKFILRDVLSNDIGAANMERGYISKPQ